MENVKFTFEVVEAAKAHVGKTVNVRVITMSSVHTRTYIRGVVLFENRWYDCVVCEYPTGYITATLEHRLAARRVSRITLQKLKHA